MYHLSQAKFFFEKQGKSLICGFFQHFLALFDTFTTRYSHTDIKFKFSDQFQYLKHIISIKFLKILTYVNLQNDKLVLPKLKTLMLAT